MQKRVHHIYIQKINREIQFNYEILNPLHITEVKKRKDDSGGSTKSHKKNVGVAVSKSRFKHGCVPCDYVLIKGSETLFFWTSSNA